MQQVRVLSYALLTAAAAVIGLLILQALFASPQAGSPVSRLVYGYVFVVTSLTFLGHRHVLGRQTEALRRLSTTDSLTGLGNRRALEDRLDNEWHRAERHGLSLALLLVDIDGLKGINDQLGHGAGDDLLRRTATAIRGSLRASDVAARLGGDEFVILAPQTSRKAARKLAERLLLLLEHPSSGEGISASVGVATFEPDASLTTDPQMLMRNADAALYCAKTHGRNRVHVAEYQLGMRHTRPRRSPVRKFAGQRTPPTALFATKA